MTQIPEPNYTQIPNIVFDYWMSKLTPAEFKVLLIICRKTFGWHKTRDKISITQIQNATSLSRRWSMNALKRLEELKLIVKEKTLQENGGAGTSYYEINVHSINDYDVNSVHGGSQLSSLGVGNSVAQGVGNSVAPQKKDYTKENINKDIMSEPEDSDVTCKFSEDVIELTKAFHRSIVSWKGKLSKTSTPERWMKDVDKMIRIDGRTKEQIVSVIVWLATSNDQGATFWKPNVLSGETLRKQFDKIEARMKSTPVQATQEASMQFKQLVASSREKWAKKDIPNTVFFVDNSTGVLTIGSKNDPCKIFYKSDSFNESSAIDIIENYMRKWGI